MKKILKRFEQFIKFGIVGFSSTIISYSINVFVIFLLRNKNISWDYVAANITAFILSVIWSYLWNNRFVFKQKEGEKRSPIKTLLKTYVAYGFTGIILNNILSWMWIDVFGVSKYIAPLLNLFFSVPINFLVNKFWAYKA